MNQPSPTLPPTRGRGNIRSKPMKATLTPTLVFALTALFVSTGFCRKEQLKATSPTSSCCWPMNLGWKGHRLLRAAP